ncbi:LysR substrate-binding domain-containing protein [Rhodococcus sp. C3V]|uniref:LysR substrate-binding domain-containing protein n=1 Tax=Rhodococcus sp. C3V TaxID=3034165 RepID=UPI0023E2A05F|nr:LysR substrate-binding domain-containing protein [Rhodococcus sp. C3V]MDF3319936.1 LysR substrate-binding domain-containing protein [Rhodococcus sp. C3V]
MDIKHVEAFLVLADELHFGRAAKQLRIAQPVLSQLIKAFEAELNVDLFVRTTRSVSLTPAGEAMLAPALVVKDKLAELRRVAAAAQDGRIGRVHVGIAGGTGYALVFQLAKITAKDAHEVVIDIHPQTFFNQAVEQLRSGDLDLAIVTAQDIPQDLEWALVKKDKLLVAVSDLHPFASKDSVRVDDLRKERIVAFPEKIGSQLRALLTKLCGEAGFTPNIVQNVSDPYSLLALVGANVGVALAGESAECLQFPGVKYVPLDGVDDVMPVYLLWRSERVSPSLKLVLTLASAHFGLDIALSSAAALHEDALPMSSVV